MTEGASNPQEWVERLLDGLTGGGDPVLVMLDDAHHLASAEAAAPAVRVARGLPAPHRLLVARAV